MGVYLVKNQHKLFLILIISISTAACVSPLNLDTFYDDQKVQDLLGGITIGYDPPTDLAPDIQWSSPPYTNWTTIKRGGTISMNFGNEIRIRAYALPGDFLGFEWKVDDVIITETLSGMINVNTNIYPFDIFPKVSYHISLVSNKEGVLYSTYFTVIVN